NNSSEYLKYTYDDLSNVELNAGDEKTFNLTITYIKESSNLTISDQAISLTLSYEKNDGTTVTETITNTDSTQKPDVIEEASIATTSNPKTNDNIGLYIVLGIVSVSGLVITFVSKKHLSKALMIVAVSSLVLIPLKANADSDKFEIVFSTNNIKNTYSELDKSIDVTLIIAKVVSGNDNLAIVNDEYYGDIIVDNNYNEGEYDYYYKDSYIDHIIPATDEEYEAVKDTLTEKNIISNNESNVPTYIWYDEDTYTLYYYSIAKSIHLNEDSSFLFAYYDYLIDLDLSKFNSQNVKNLDNFIYYNSSLKNITFGDYFDTSNVTSMVGTFAYNLALESLDIRCFNTSNVTNMDSLFSADYNLTDLKYNLDTKNVTNMAAMFYNARSLESIDLSNFNTSKVTNMDSMFYGMKALKSIDVSTFDTKNVTNMGSMFTNLNSIESIDVSNFDTRSLTEFKSMFYGLTGVSTIDISNFDTSKVTNASGLFYGCTNLTTINLGKFDSSSLTDANQMFANNENLTTIYVSSDYVPKNGEVIGNLFNKNTSLKGGANTPYSSTQRTYQYARIDEGSSNPGYFTVKQN
nr:DUF285 domain-containing protein [Bacilli bacterium]